MVNFIRFAWSIWSGLPGQFQPVFTFKIVKNYLSAFDLQINYSFEKKIHHFVIAIILGLWFSNWLITISIILTIVGIMATIQVLKNKNNYHNCSF